MSERPRGEQPEFVPMPDVPVGLDVVRLDGRWAQVLASDKREITIRYLDDGSTEQGVSLADYELVRRLDTHVGWLAQRIGEGLTDEERSRLHFGFETQDHPEFVDDIHVYGEYRKRDQ